MSTPPQSIVKNTPAKFVFVRTVSVVRTARCATGSCGGSNIGSAMGHSRRIIFEATSARAALQKIETGEISKNNNVFLSHFTDLLCSAQF